MNNKSIVENKNILITLLFFLITLIYSVKADGDIFAYGDFCLPPNQTEIELLLPDYQDSDLEFRFFIYPSKHLIHFVSSGINSFGINNKALFYFNIYVNHQFKSLNRTFIPTNSFISVLQKTIQLHQSSDDDPFLLS